MFEFLEHPSETLIQVTATTTEDVFRDAATALFEVMTNTTAIRVVQTFPVELESPERHLLLIDWLNRLIFLHEVEHVFLCAFDLKLAEQNGWKLKALAGGERISENHERRSHAKSATYGFLEWKETGAGHVVRFVIDI